MGREKNLSDCKTIEEVDAVKTRNKKRYWDQKDKGIQKERRRKWFLAVGVGALFATMARLSGIA